MGDSYSDSHGVQAELAPDGAFCAVHPEVVARYVCSRCGSYACESCSTTNRRGLLCPACLAVAQAEDPTHLGEASQLQRFLNALIDVWVGANVFGFMVFFALALLGFESLPEGRMAERLWGWALMFVYYVLVEGLTGRSLGKLITGTRVISADGGRPSFAQIVKRSAVRLVPFDAFSFLGSDRGWHDRWSGTRVVRTRGEKKWDADERLR